MERAREASGTLIYRDEDLDSQRCKPEYSKGALEDLSWFGCQWSEGPDIGGSFGPYTQSERIPLYLDAWKHLKEAGFIYPCRKSRKDVANATQAPHAEDETEPIYPESWRPPIGTGKTEKTPVKSTGAFVSQTIILCNLMISDSDPAPLNACGTSAISSSGVRMDCLPTNSRWLSTTMPWASPKSCAAKICSSQPHDNY